MIRSLIVAMDRNRVIGHTNGLPWRLPEDLIRFKRLTMGHPVLMGRLTHESIGKALPGRRNIVISRQPGFVAAPGCQACGSLEEAWKLVGDVPEAFVIGGAQIYEAAFPAIDRFYLTEVEAETPGDTYFPAFDRSEWQVTDLGRQEIDPRHAFAMQFLRLDRKRP
jgi:dihydrofolate reductase